MDDIIDDLGIPLGIISITLITIINILILFPIQIVEHEFKQYSCESLLENIQEDSSVTHKQDVVHEWIKKECWKNGG